MTAISRSTKRKLSFLQLAAELGTVPKACRVMGYHRDNFYEIKRAFQMGGTAALVEQRRSPGAPHPNRVSEKVERAVLDYSLQFPTHGALRVVNELHPSIQQWRARCLVATRSVATGAAPSAVGDRGPWRHHPSLQ